MTQQQTFTADLARFDEHCSPRPTRSALPTTAYQWIDQTKVPAATIGAYSRLHAVRLRQRPCLMPVTSAAATVPPVAKPNMVMRSIRVPLTLWTDAKAKADERGENISDVLRDALETYVKEQP